jgi:hypothetical protein
MTKLSEVTAEIHRLIDDQMKALQGKFTPPEAAKYKERHERIEQLLKLITNNHLERD